MHETLRQMEDEFEQRKKSVNSLNPWYGVWMSSGVLKFDKMKVKEKLVFNPHTMGIVGYIGEGINDDVIGEEFKKLVKQHDTEEGKDKDDGESMNPQP